MDFCEKNEIILFLLPPHTSHLLQPLDVGVFHAFKHWHSETIADATQTGCGKFTKIEFLAALSSIRQKTFKKRTVRHGFSLTGIHPFDPDVVLDKLAEDRPATPNRESSMESFSSGSTPKTARKFALQGNIITSYHAEGIPFKSRLDKLLKASISQAHLAEELQREIQQSTQAQRARRERAGASRQQLQTGGVVYSDEVSRISRIKKENDERKERMALRRKWKEVMTELVDYALDRGIIVKRSRLSRGR